MKINFIQRLIRFLLLIGILIASCEAEAQEAFKVLVIASADPDHDPMKLKSRSFLEKIGNENNFEVDFSRDAELINDENLSHYKVFVQMHLAPLPPIRSVNTMRSSSGLRLDTTEEISLSIDLFSPSKQPDRSGDHYLSMQLTT